VSSGFPPFHRPTLEKLRIRADIVRFVTQPFGLHVLLDVSRHASRALSSRLGISRCNFPRKERPMAHTTVSQITIVYRGETQQFATVSLAAHFLRQDRIKMGWFHTIKAVVDLVVDDGISQTRHLKGDKFLIMQELVQLERDLKPSPA
jgi:hypothetical protein